ncbi:hypothetical protein NDA13_000251 [Ustilago tritici]|nr:hypothetical protein NDA13_000251 [Ustilago tritici]
MQSHPRPGWRICRCFAMLLSFLPLFVTSCAAISAAIPVSNLEVSEAITATLGYPYLFGNESGHRQLLVKRHEQIASAPVAAGFVHPTHLYRRDADALPPPNKAYNLTVTQGTINPDGFERDGFLMNGKYPADPFIWDENDDIEITVNNQSPVPFAIHWHGIHQIGTPEMDGVPGLSQWNIYPEQSYTYRFKLVNQYGGYWYHSHERGYYADGLRGTIYIRPKPDRRKPWSLISPLKDNLDQMEAAEGDYQIMSLSDHWHINHTQMLLTVHETGVPPACFDSLLINGRGRQYCVNDWSSVMSPVQASLLHNFSSINPEGPTSKGCISLVSAKSGYTVKDTLDTRYGGVCQNTTAPLTVLDATKAIKEGRRWINLQIIDTATNWYYGLSIDGHMMWIVAVDGHYIEPMLVDFAQITIGSRLSVMIEVNPDLVGNIYPIRLTGARALQPIEGIGFLSYIDDIGDTWSPSQEEAFAYLDRTLTPAHLPMNGFSTDKTVIRWQQNLSYPFDAVSPVPQTSNMTLHAVASQNSLNVWQVASVPLDTAHLADVRPMLFNATDGNATSNQNIPYATIPFGTVVDIILENNIYSIVGGPNSPHPFHMHSRRFWIIGTGTGIFPADTVGEAQAKGVPFNLENPPLRDGFDIDANSWVAIRYVVDHAAANILHCHIDDHAIEGMAAVLLEGLETIPAGGNFSEAIKARPANYVETQNDELGKVLEEAIATGLANSRYIEPAATETSMPWGDPRALAASIQIVASSNSVQHSITSSLQSQMSLVQATATETITAVTATVSDQATVFTGVPASATVAAAATVTVATVTDTVAATGSGSLQSTLNAAAYTTRVATSLATLTYATYSSPRETAYATDGDTTYATYDADDSLYGTSFDAETVTPSDYGSVVAYSTLYRTQYDSSYEIATATSAYAAEETPYDDDTDEYEAGDACASSTCEAYSTAEVAGYATQSALPAPTRSAVTYSTLNSAALVPASSTADATNILAITRPIQSTLFLTHTVFQTQLLTSTPAASLNRAASTQIASSADAQHTIAISTPAAATQVSTLAAVTQFTTFPAASLATTFATLDPVTSLSQVNTAALTLTASNPVNTAASHSQATTAAPTLTAASASCTAATLCTADAASQSSIAVETPAASSNPLDPASALSSAFTLAETNLPSSTGNAAAYGTVSASVTFSTGQNIQTPIYTSSTDPSMSTDEPAYVNPIFPTATVSATEEVESKLNEAVYGTISSPATARAAATRTTDSFADDDGKEEDDDDGNEDESHETYLSE